MKLVKLILCALALVTLTAPAFAGVGVMSKDDVREGQLVCPIVKAKLEREQARHNVAAARQKAEDAADEAAISAR